MDVRRIAPDEWPLLRELRLASLSDAPEAFGQRYENALAVPEAEWRSAARAAAAGDRRAWFICRATLPNGSPREVGLVQARRRPPGDCLLFSMWVAPAARRTGAGRALIDAVRGWGASWGASRIVLWVFGANEGALRFYLRLGFRVLDHGPDVDAGREFGALAMDLAVT